MSTKHSQTRSLLWVLGIMAGLFVLALAGIFLKRAPAPAMPKIDGVYLPAPRVIQPFKLSATDGRPFNQDSLRGRWTMLFFGFTNCGQVCPTTMAALNNMYRFLQASLPDRVLPQVVMVTVDPERDSLDRLRSYVHAFNPAFVGARTDIANTVVLEKQLHIAAAKIQAGGRDKSQYTIEHSAEILLFNPQGALQAYLSWPHEAFAMARDYRAILAVAGTKSTQISVANSHAVLQDTHHKNWRFSDLQGKWIILNDWAAWCEGCWQEVPALNRFYRELAGDDVKLFGISFESVKPTALKKAADSMHMAYPSFLENPSNWWNLPVPAGLPVTFIIGPDGKLKKTLEGPQTVQSMRLALQEAGKHE